MSRDLYDLQREHGGTVYGAGRRWIGPGPGHSRKDASLSVRVGDDGRLLLHSFAGDPFTTCASYLGLTQANASPEDKAAALVRRREREAADRAQAKLDADFCERVWRGTVPLEGSPAERYLFGRGLIMDWAVDLRFHEAAPRDKGWRITAPAMVAVVRDRASVARALHATYLKPDGSGKAFGKHSRLIFSKPAGGAVQLRPMGPDGVLAVAEGIETAASFDVLTGIPTWAAVSAGGLSRFQPPPRLRKLVIASDADDAGVGARAANDLAGRVRERLAVEIRPAPSGWDWNDALVAQEKAS